MYPLLTIDEINQRRREREAAAAQFRIARTLRRQTADSGRHAAHRFGRRPTAPPRPVGER